MDNILTNYHTHTKRCHHAEKEDIDYILKAIDEGFSILGFSDHEEISEEHYVSLEEAKRVTKEYISSIKKYQEEFKDKIEIHLGLEAAYHKDIIPHLLDLKKQGIEYFIMGQHEAKDKEGNIHNIFSKEIDHQTIKLYVDLVIEGMETGLFKYVAHPDLFMLGVNKVDKFILSEIDRLCLMANKYDVPLELNMPYYHRPNKFHPTSSYLLNSMHKHNVKGIIGLDAHSPSAINKHIYAEGEALAKEYGVNLIKVLKI